MIEKKTVIVVGAGASAECKLPTGYELNEKIAQLLNISFRDGYAQSSGDRLIVNALQVAVQRANPKTRDINPYLGMARRIRAAMPQAMSGWQGCRRTAQGSGQEPAHCDEGRGLLLARLRVEHQRLRRNAFLSNQGNSAIAGSIERARVTVTAGPLAQSLIDEYQQGGPITQSMIDATLEMNEQTSRPQQ